MAPNTELVLNALGYTPNEALKEQVLRIFNACDIGENGISHILNLHDKLSIYDGFVALSNSEDVFKIKCNSSGVSQVFSDIVNEWATKYKFKIQKVAGKQTYYILGHE